MGTRISEKRRAAILADLDKDGLKWARIAKKHGISDGTVKNIAKEAGLWAPSRAGVEATKSITEVRLAQAREKRAVLSVELLDRAKDYLEQSRQKAIVYKFGGKENDFNSHQLAEPDFAGKRDLATAMAICIDRSMALERHDSDEGQAARGAIIALVESLTDKTDKTEKAAP